MSRLLNVDDDEVIIAANRRLFKRQGIEVVGAQSVDEALSLFAESPQDYDLILTDFQMPPGHSGLILLNDLKLTYQELPPRVMLSGRADIALCKAAMECGASGVIKKPYDTGFLRTVAQELIADGKSPTLNEYLVKTYILGED